MKKKLDCWKELQFNMPEMYQKKKFKNRRLKGCKYEYSTWMGDDLGWVDTFRDIKGEKILNNYYKAKADFEDRSFQFKLKLSKENKSKRQAL